MAIIEVKDLTKEYRLGAMHSLKQTLLNTAARLSGKNVEERPLFKALDDVSFSIKPGEVVGIIGHNGAGKSTLLKMLAKISIPTSGSVKVDGRIAPLIEVGAGFVPDFTGRENVYLNGAILGMSRQEIDKKFDEIVDYSEMAKFIDTPVKRYSSGMQVKLAFAVATSIESEILIVDEVLAVGDLAFQRKCFDRMEDLIKKQNKTVLLVSHSIRQVERICDRVILLDRGRIIQDGRSKDVCNNYYKMMNAKIKAQYQSENRTGVISSGEVDDIEVLLYQDKQQDPTTSLVMRSAVEIVLRLRVNTPLENADIAIGFHTTDLLYIATFNTQGQEIPINLSVGEHTIRCIVRDMQLLPSVYGLRVSIAAQNARSVWYSDNVCTFSVDSGNRNRARMSLQSLVEMDVDWQLGDSLSQPG